MSSVFLPLTLVFPLFASGLMLVLSLRHFRHRSLFRYPLDAGYIWKGKRVFGDNKTIGGVGIYLFGSVFVCAVLSRLSYVHTVFSYNPVLLGLVYGGGYVGGECINSFVKRRCNIGPGEIQSRYQQVQRMVDLIDGIVIVCVLLWGAYGLSIKEVMLAGIYGVTVHRGFEILMEKLNLKKARHRDT